MDSLSQLPDVTISTTAERVARARATHRSVSRTLTVIFLTLAVVVAALGFLLSLNGKASLPGSLVVAAVFAVIPGLVGLSLRRMERNAERFLGTDGVTQFVVGNDGLRVGPVEIPYSRITCIYATVTGEEYSGGGRRGEAMATRLDLAEDRPGIGRAVGGQVGTLQRRRLYRDGAKSTISLMIGVDQKATLGAPVGFINALRTLPQRGDDPGRIDVPFGAYLGTAELEILLEALWSRTHGDFPLGVVSGAGDWASATTSAAETRDSIREESERLLASQ